jgi:hypothetical protein
MDPDDRLWRFRRRRADYKAVFEASPAGRRVLADLRRFCLMDAALEGPTAERTHVNVGQRNVFLHIARCLAVDPDALEKLTRSTEHE